MKQIKSIAMIFKTILTGLLSAAYKADTNGELFALINSEGLTEEQGNEILKQILELDAKKVASIKGDNTNIFQDGYKKAKGEVLGEFEKTIFEKYPNANKELKGLDLVNSIIASSSNTDKQITDADILSSSVYLQNEKRLRDEASKLVEEKITEINNLKAFYKKEKQGAIIQSKVASMLEKLGAVIPSDPIHAQTAQRNLLRDILENDFDIKDDGTILVLKEGKPLQDAHGNVVDFEDHVKGNISSYYSYSKNNGGDNSGTPPNGGNGSGSETIKKFNNLNDLFAYTSDPSISHELRAKTLEANNHLD